MYASSNSYVKQILESHDIPTSGYIGSNYNCSKLNPLIMPSDACCNGNQDTSVPHGDSKTEILNKFLPGWNNTSTTYGYGVTSCNLSVSSINGAEVDMGTTAVYYNEENIKCTVDRIDAVLIANGKVDTCAGKTPHPQPQTSVNPNSDVNSIDRSNQLIINGTIIADTMILGRTYGAATGNDSDEPAEIINYDTSLCSLGRSQADITTSGKLNSVYSYELAPKY